MDSTTAYVFSMDQSFPIGPANGYVLDSYGQADAKSSLTHNFFPTFGNH